jgi:DNA-binding transcriptional LysR family regulator
MKLSAFDLNHARALHFLLDEGHVARAATRLGITPAAASNALRRLRDEFGDPLLVKKGRGLRRTRVGDELRAAAAEVVRSAERLVGLARPFDPASYDGVLPIAMADHVAAILLGALDRRLRREAPSATLAVAPIPIAVSDWLEQSGGVLITPSGRFAATAPDDGLRVETLYEDRYVCLMRPGHPGHHAPWSAARYAALGHVLVTPRGSSPRSDIDEHLAASGLSRRIARIVPSFALALPLVADSDWITTIPARCVPKRGAGRLVARELPFRMPPLAMKLVFHPAHAGDARLRFITRLLHEVVGKPRD